MRSVILDFYQFRLIPSYPGEKSSIGISIIQRIENLLAVASFPSLSGFVPWRTSIPVPIQIRSITNGV